MNSGTVSLSRDTTIVVVGNYLAAPPKDDVRKKFATF
jgi:hypothetical protein